jgi:hypothetical protein
LFDANAATPALRPAGLLNGVPPLTPTAGGGQNALVSDIKNLIAAIAPVAGNGQIAVVAPADKAAAILMQTISQPFAVLASSALPPARVIAVATNAIASAMEAPEIESSRDSAIHMESATPGAVVASAPTYSMYQMDSASLKLRWPVSWAERSTQAVAYIDTIRW